MSDTCAARADHCHCVNASPCDGVHVCECGGSWSGELDGADFVIHVLPEFDVTFDQAGVNAAQGLPLLVDEFQQVMARVAVQLAEAPEQVVALQTPKQRALDILAPHLDDEPLYHPHA